MNEQAQKNNFHKIRGWARSPEPVKGAVKKIPLPGRQWPYKRSKLPTNTHMPERQNLAKKGLVAPS